MNVVQHCRDLVALRCVELISVCWSPSLCKLSARLYSATACISSAFLISGCFVDNPDNNLFLTWFGRFSLENKQRVSWTISHVSLSFNIRIQDVEFATQLPKVLLPTFLADLLLSSNLKRHSRSVVSNFCLVQFHSWLRLYTCSCSIKLADRHSWNYAFHK